MYTNMHLSSKSSRCYTYMHKRQYFTHIIVNNNDRVSEEEQKQIFWGAEFSQCAVRRTVGWTMLADRF